MNSRVASEVPMQANGRNSNLLPVHDAYQPDATRNK